MVPHALPTVILLAALASSGASRCLTDLEEVRPSRFFNYEGEVHDIRLEVSRRAAHRMITYIFKIFLQEALGYPYVAVVEQEDYFNAYNVFHRLSGPLGETKVLVPTATVNLEVWLPPIVDAISWSSAGHVEEVGVMGPPGRFGWFIPKALASHLNGSYHWHIFANLHIASTFSVPDRYFTNYVEPHLRNSKTKRFYCEGSFCSEGIYTPSKCRHPTFLPCAILFAGDPEYSSFVVDHIEELGLFVRVAWVGPNLKKLVENLTDLYVHEASMGHIQLSNPSVRGPLNDNITPLGIPDNGRSIILLSWRPGEVVQELDEDLGASFDSNPHSSQRATSASTYKPDLLMDKNKTSQGIWFGEKNYHEEEIEEMDLGRNSIDKSHENRTSFSSRGPATRKGFASSRGYVSIAFPPCESVSSLKSAGCKYEMHRLVKVVWSSLKEGARTAYEAIHRVSFSPMEYKNLLERYTNRGFSNESSVENIEELACDWLHSNKHIWQSWIPRSDKQKTTLYIGGIFPITGSTYTARGIVIAAKMATDAINSNDTVLRDYTLKLHAYDGQCKADMVMKSFIEYIRLDDYNRFVGILGPACSDTVEPLAGVSRHFKTVVISYSAEGSSFSDRKKYPYFYRTIGENKQYRHVYLKLFNKLGWSRVAALTEDGQKYTEYISHLQDLLQANGITFVSNRKFPRERGNAAMSQYLVDLKNKNARVIIADVYDDAARSVMCEAYHQQMTAYNGYVWFLPLWLSPLWYDTDSHNRGLNPYLGGKYGNSSEYRGPIDSLNGKSDSVREQIRCTTAQMIEAINGHLAMTHAYFAPENEIMQESLTVGEWRKRYQKRCLENKFMESNYAGYAYDAVWTYALALDALIAENQSHVADLHSDDTAREFVTQINQTDFNGVSGHIKFVGGPSRISVINVMQWLNHSTRIVGSFSPNVSEEKGDVVDGSLVLNMSAIVWLNGGIPWDGSNPPRVCVLEGLANILEVSCEVAIVVANVIGFGFLGILIIAAFIVMKRRYEKKVQMQQKYMKSLGLDLLSASNMHSLDKWEIPRDKVVINRKLGEGAFGTVYGGEADFNERGWVAVAVKTLKVGSNTEEKLDFLSEAEVMKRFDHKNVVKLLGVCTKNEPVYTVMEFMLYGDLKTFLLARRHLVSEKNAEESDEISSKKLTNMALDVARGLSYLAELKYVHRDIASRNCLINASRVVKLGDFGMTRPMYENDYYKFNRKGMLPVRWMAPESLGLGIFTPMSDVWSYGVFLYELITFGSFPFQGMSNNQVLEHVKAGNTLTIPVGVKQQLEALLRSCWYIEVKMRPQASEIVDFLANNPRLISPCLDVPLASVQMEDSDQLEMHLPERIRKCSMSLTSGCGNESGGSALRHRSMSDNGEGSQTAYCRSADGPTTDGEESGIVTDMESQHPSAAQLTDNGCALEPLLGDTFREPPSSSGVCLSKYVAMQRTGGVGTGGKNMDPRKSALSATSIL